MPALTHDTRLFGLDLSTFGRDLRAGWDELLGGPAFAWLAPRLPVRLLRADGSESLWTGARRLRPAPGLVRPGAAPFLAVEVPEDQLLRRSLSLPALSDAELADAVALDVAGASPFAGADLVWGHHAGPLQRGQRRVEIALASRPQLLRHLRTLAPSLPPGAAGSDGVELWALTGDGTAPIVLGGFGEHRRLARVQAVRRRNLGLLLLALLLLLAIAATPTAQLRLRGIDAVGAYDRLTQSAAPLLAKREALVAASDRLTTLRELLADHVDPLRVVDLLSRVLPDDTYLSALQVDGLKVRMAGQTTNTATLMQMLGVQPGLRDVRAPTPATRYPGAAQENFTIEFTLEPNLFRPALPAAVAAAPASAPASTPAPVSDRARLVMSGPAP